MDDVAGLIYIGAIAGTLLSVVAAILSLRARAQLEARLPAAARLEDLIPRLAEVERQFGVQRGALAAANLRIAEATALNEEISRAKEELLQLRSDREAQETIRGDLAAQKLALAEVETRLREANAAASEIAERMREREQLELRVAALRKETEAAARAEMTAQAQLARVTGELAARERDLKGRQEELAVTQVRARDLQLAAAKAEQERAFAAQQRDQLRTDLEDTREALAAGKVELEAIRAEISTQTSLRQQATEQVASIDRRLADRGAMLKETNEALETAREKLETVEAASRTALTAKADAEARVKSLEAERKGILDSIASLKATQERLLEQIKRTAPDPAQAEAELWQPILARPRISVRTARSEEQALDGVRAHLDALGLVFPQRTLHAFHTSLKVAEQSPMVVLAGISGTGKSELPRRYAEAMGMHFLPMAVQPRWDGPQDLFGFYNYLEHRYRPTELTRALLQMDAVRDAAGRGWRPPADWVDKQSCSDQVLLVLFDEMNLARVEYYFSDFLSKLETRRGLNRDDGGARSKAEIVLEVGPRDKGGSSMRIFTDTNVLFVGTMNEDESTQTLSDKVVDRANVLRFGRPGRLQRRDPASAAARVKPPAPLTHKQFKDWGREDDVLGDSGPRLDGLISRLNEAMDRVGRPFAHRTHQAIRAYVANYPVQAEEGFRCAVGDQIEQRILPKLRGVDLAESAGAEALEVVRGVCQEIDDRPLIDSIDSARQLHPHQFSWQGVDRGQAEESLVG